MLSQTVFPPDIRIEKEIKTLSENGYEITIICNQYDKKKSPDFPYCRIERVKALFSSYRLNKIFNFPFFLNPRYVLKVFLTVIRIKPKIIHAHDLPMVPLALMINFFFRLPIIYDMHENYPEALKYFDKKGIINFIFKNYKLARYLDNFCIKHCDKIIVVIDENKDRLIAGGIDPNKIFIVSNTVSLETFNVISNDTSFSKIYNDKKVILYSGTVSPDRGLDTPILAMEILKEKISNALLMIIGEGSHKNYLEDLCKKKLLNNYVKFINWPGHENLANFISLASVCIIPQPNNDFINTTIPHKLFEYMRMSKPVLVSDAIPLARIVRETDCGEVFVSNNPESFANHIYDMLNSKMKFGQNGYDAVLNKYNWEQDKKELQRLYYGFNSIKKN